MVNEKGNLILDNKGKPVIENPVLNQKQGLLERASDFYSNYLLSQYNVYYEKANLSSQKNS